MNRISKKEAYERVWERVRLTADITVDDKPPQVAYDETLPENCWYVTWHVEQKSYQSIFDCPPRLICISKKTGAVLKDSFVLIGPGKTDRE
jgi:hypothetical protein